MKYLLILLVFLSCNVKHQRISLVNTEWKYEFEDFCMSYITFKADNIYENYDCEWDYLFSGRYHIKNDTIYLVQFDFASDVLQENNPKVIKGRSTYLFKENYLQYLSWEDYDWKTEKWTRSCIFPGTDIIYKKVTESMNYKTNTQIKEKPEPNNIPFTTLAQKLIYYYNQDY